MKTKPRHPANHDSYDPLLPQEAVAERLGISVKTLAKWRSIGTGPRFIKIGAAPRYPQRDLMQWLDTRQGGGETA